MSEKFFADGNSSIYAELLVFALGGAAYGLIEAIFRGYTHWSMVLTGGACVLTLYLLSDWLMSMNLIAAAMAGALLITAYEFCVGLIVNIKLGWDVWDYSSLPYNIMGQICPIYTFVWFTLCFIFLGLVKLLS